MQTTEPTYIYKKQEVQIVKSLSIMRNKVDRDNYDWVQIEFLSGDNKGARKPVQKKELKKV
jgi:hypothetical protein